MKKATGKLRYTLQLWDGIWSIPMAIFGFIGIGFFLQYIFGSNEVTSVATYDPSFIQLAFYVSVIMTFINFIVSAGIFFNFRGLWKYYHGSKNKETGEIINKSKNDFQALTAWQRIALFLFVFCFLSVEFVTLFMILL